MNAAARDIPLFQSRFFRLHLLGDIVPRVSPAHYISSKWSYNLPEIGFKAAAFSSATDDEAVCGQVLHLLLLPRSSDSYCPQGTVVCHGFSLPDCVSSEGDSPVQDVPSNAASRLYSLCFCCSGFRRRSSMSVPAVWMAFLLLAIVHLAGCGVTYNTVPLKIGRAHV